MHDDIGIHIFMFYAKVSAQVVNSYIYIRASVDETSWSETKLVINIG